MRTRSTDTKLLETIELTEAAITSDERREVEVTCLVGGTSKNGWHYTDQLLQASAPIFEGARAFADHIKPTDNPERSVRDIVGYYHSPRFEAATADTPARIKATLKVLESADWLWSMIRETINTGMPFMGLSVDFIGAVRPKGPIKEVLTMKQLRSVDVVTRPSAGGAFEHILQSEQTTEEEEEDVKTREELELELSEANTAREAAEQALATATAAGKAEAIADAQAKIAEAEARATAANAQLAASGTAVTEAKAQAAAAAASAGSAAASATAVADKTTEVSAAVTEASRMRDEAQAALVETQRLLETARKDRDLAATQAELEVQLREAARLPEPFKAKLRKQFEGQIATGEVIKEAIQTDMDALASVFSAGMITGMGGEKASITSRPSIDRLQTALTLMFESPALPFSDISESDRSTTPKLGGIREAYVLATGDTDINGHTNFDTALISEADTTSASFSFLLGTSMNKRLMKEYQAWPNEWVKFTSVVPIKDFKLQDRIRLASFGSLPKVTEDAPYTTVSLSDTRAQYQASKYGNIVAVSREVIVNDDLQAIRQIPQKLAVAAAYSLAEFVYGFLSGGRTTVIYDGNNLFDAAAGPFNHGHNRRVDALATAGLTSGITTMKEQTNLAGKRIGLKPSYLIVPPELEFTAIQMMKSGGLPGGNNNDINPIMGYAEVLVAPQLANTAEWYFVADPRLVDTIEIGFVGGQVNPVLLVQDQPLFGLNFTQDAISYKVRHEYGGAVLDYRGFYSGGD